MPRLVVKRGNSKVRELTSTSDIVTIGRAKTNDVKLSGNKSISRHHAALMRLRGKDEYFVRDLGSFSPVRINGETVHRKLLADGGTIEIEDYTLQYNKTGEPSSVIEIIPYETERRVQNRDETATHYYQSVTSGFIPGEISLEKGQALLDILRQI